MTNGDQSRYDGLLDEILQFGVERRLARVKACRGRTCTGLRQALPERAHRMEKRRGTMSKVALTSLALGAAMAVGTAQAEPLTLSADQMDQVTAAGFGFAEFFANLEKTINVNKTVTIDKTVTKFQDVFVFGLFGEADAFANCYDASGFGCQAVTETFTDAVSGFEGTSAAQVTSVSLSESATSGAFILNNFDDNND
jgi:hypothetical protein